MFPRGHHYEHVSSGQLTPVIGDHEFEMHSWDIGDELGRDHGLTANNGYPLQPTTPIRETDLDPLLRVPSTDYRGRTHSMSISAADAEQVSFNRPKQLFAGWQQCVMLSCTCTILALFCNIGLLAWSLTKPPSQSSTRVLWDGDCDKSKTILTWSHLAINVLSTAILSGSNYAMQILVAPTRENLDAAHRQRRSLDIGIPGFANWAYIGRRRRLLYLSLLMTSIPLHLIYNSVIFGTISAYDVDMYLVSRDFLQVQPSSHTIQYNSTDDLYTLWERAVKGNWTRLDDDTCYSTFAVDFIHNYKNVALVSNNASSDYNGTYIDQTTHLTKSISGQNYQWFCAKKDGEDCEPDQSQAKDWWITEYPDTSCNVQYCVAEPAQPFCTVELMPQLLSIIIVCNVLKATALVVLIFLRFNPLLTIGDAISSFMDRPDDMTKGWGTTSAEQLRMLRLQPVQYSTGMPRAQPWKSQKQRYFSGAAPGRWTLTLVLCLTYWAIGCFLEYLGFSSANESLQRQWAQGLGSIIPKSTATSWNVSVVVSVLVANIPQLVLSLVYLFYNALFTCMLVSAEWMDFAHDRKGLRVTHPVGCQRSTYFLSLPYRFSLPLIMASVLLHWMLSESLFLVQVNAFDSSGAPVNDGGLHTIGWSPIALMILVIIGGLLIIGVIVFGFRRYPGGMPLVLSDSRAISAACHPSEGGPVRQSQEKIQYGVIWQPRVAEQEANKQAADRQHVGFSSEAVEPLVDGQIYS